MKIHLHGNCQSYAMSMMLRETYPKWDVSYFEIHTDLIIKQNDDYRAAIRSADIILTQPVHPGYRGRPDLSSDWVKNEAKQGCAIVVIPAMHFEGHHPAYGGLGLGDLCTNIVAAHLVAVGVAPEVAVSTLLSLDLFDKNFVASESEVSLGEMVRRETTDKIDIPLSPVARYISDGVQLFHVVNHPTRPIYAYILKKVLEHLSLERRPVLTSGTDYQSSPHIPMLPAVANHCPPSGELPAEWRIADDGSVRIPNYHPMTQQVYLERMIGQLMQTPPDQIQSTIRINSRAVAVLRRLSKTKTNVPDLELW